LNEDTNPYAGVEAELHMIRVLLEKMICEKGLVTAT